VVIESCEIGVSRIIYPETPGKTTFKKNKKINHNIKKEVKV
jgi:hypothetical protein